MAIRGTTPYASCESASQGCLFGGKEGEYVLLHKILGKVLATINDPSVIVSLRSVDASPIASSPNPAKQAAMQQLFQSLHNTVEILNERLEDGEGLIREAGTGSPNFPTNEFVESIAGFFKSSVTKLLGKVQANPEIADIKGQLEQKISPQLIGNTDEDTSTIVEVITEDDILGLGPLATVIGAIVTSGLGIASVRADGLSVIYDPGVAYNHLAVGVKASRCASPSLSI